jgi:hypothetical protein
VGFSIGLTVAGVAAYLLILRRMQQNKLANEQFQLSQNGHLHGASRNVEQEQTRPQAQHAPLTYNAAAETAVAAETSPAFAVAGQQAGAKAETTSERPADAVFLGVVGTRCYYPVDTPLDQLASASNEHLDIVYFSSEEEAKAEGYSAK